MKNIHYTIHLLIEESHSLGLEMAIATGPSLMKIARRLRLVKNMVD
jgi:hypothetical protein